MMSRDKEHHPKPSHPPPPYDPFQRYQHPWPRSEQDDENPFIRFRRYADEQFKAMFGNTWPRSTRPFGTRTHEEIEQTSEESWNALTNRMNRNTIDLADRVQSLMALVDSETERMHQAMRRDAQKSATPTAHTSQNQQQANTELDLYHAMPGNQPAITVVAGPDGMPQSAPPPARSIEALNPFVSEEDFWPYMAASPYSPLRLDLSTSADSNKDDRRDGTVEAVEARLRLLHAFDDLFRLSHSREMLPEADRTDVTSSKISSIVDTASFAPSLESSEHKQHGDPKDKSDAASKSSAEEAAASHGTPLASTLGHFLREVEGIADGFVKAFSGNLGEITPQQSHDHSNTNPSSIVSTMTKTETRTLPDGSVETRKVLKRRFADGNEEHEESVTCQPTHEAPTREVPDWLRTHLAAAKYPTVDKQTQTQKQTQTAATDDNPSQQEKTSNGGWFWRR